MSLMQQIPKDFYRVFRTKNREHYIAILIELYKANMEEYNTFGLTKNECRDIINETMVEQSMVWQEDEEEVEAELDAEDDFEKMVGQMEIKTPSYRSLNNLLNWGWLRSDYDEQINEDVITFPEYSLMFVELFWQLNMDSDSQERESIMSIYSLLYTYHTDKDHNNEILKNAWKASRRLTQLLNNMQDGMRDYFDKLSQQKNFLGIQENRNYPNSAFWEVAAEVQCPVTFGCDAHWPERAFDGETLEKAKEMVKQYGLNYIGKPTIISIQH